MTIILHSSRYSGFVYILVVVVYVVHRGVFLLALDCGKLSCCRGPYEDAGTTVQLGSVEAYGVGSSSAGSSISIEAPLLATYSYSDSAMGDKFPALPPPDSSCSKRDIIIFRILSNH